MDKVYITVANEASAEFTEKKSLFIGHAKHTENEEDAAEFIKAKQKEYRDATHNVWAYQMKNGVIARYSDDGEPTGTAGLPTLEAIRKSTADDLTVVVTRYFGGILLGAGGLVRAYAKAASMAIASAAIVTYEGYTEIETVCTYSDHQKIVAELPKYGAKTDSTDFSENVTVKMAVKDGLADALMKKVTELTAGRAVVRVIGKRLDRE